MSGRTLILGGGFGGIAASVELRRLLGPQHEVVLVDRTPTFAMGLRKLWELVGHATIAEGSRERRLLERHGIEFVEAEITSIDARARSAETGAGPLAADHLVIPLGAVSRPDLVARARRARTRRLGLLRRRGRRPSARRLRRRPDRRPRRGCAVPVPARSLRMRPPPRRAPAPPRPARTHRDLRHHPAADADAERRTGRF